MNTDHMKAESVKQECAADIEAILDVVVPALLWLFVLAYTAVVLAISTGYPKWIHRLLLELIITSV